MQVVEIFRFEYFEKFSYLDHLDSVFTFLFRH